MVAVTLTRLQTGAVDDLDVDGELAAGVVEDKDADGATAGLEGAVEAGPEVGLVNDRQVGLDIAGLGHGGDVAVREVEDTVLLEDGAEHGLDNDAGGGVGDEGGLLVKLLGEEVDTEVAVLARGGGGGDLDDLAGAALEDQEVTEADVVAGDGDGVGEERGTGVAGGRRAGSTTDLGDLVAGGAALLVVVTHLVGLVLGGRHVGGFDSLFGDLDGLLEFLGARALGVDGVLVDVGSGGAVVVVVVRGEVGGEVRVVVGVVVVRVVGVVRGGVVGLVGVTRDLRRTGVVRVSGQSQGTLLDGDLFAVVAGLSALTVLAFDSINRIYQVLVVTVVDLDTSVVVELVGGVVEVLVDRAELLNVGVGLDLGTGTGTVVVFFDTDLFGDAVVLPGRGKLFLRERRDVTFPSGLVRLLGEFDLKLFVGSGYCLGLGLGLCLALLVGGGEDAEGDGNARFKIQIGGLLGATRRIF